MSSVHSQDKSVVESRSLDWIQRVVVGLNLCPFANRVVKSGDVLLQTEFSADVPSVLATLVKQCSQVQASSNEATLLLLLPNGFEDFEHFLDLVDDAEALLIEIGLEGVLQIATFHPHYQFSGTQFDDAANFTNRSPYPMLHLLQEKAVGQALDQHPDPAAIPDRNIDKLRSMNTSQLQRLINGEEDHHES